MADNTYRIECLDCGDTALGDLVEGDEIKRDKEYHRTHHCPDAEFEVSR